MSVQTIASAAEAQRPCLLDQVRGMALARFGRPEPGERHAEWARHLFLKRIPSFRMRHEALHAERTVVLFARAAT